MHSLHVILRPIHATWAGPGPGVDRGLLHISGSGRRGGDLEHLGRAQRLHHPDGQIRAVTNMALCSAELRAPGTDFMDTVLDTSLK